MPAPNGSTFDGNAYTVPATTNPYRPGASDFNGNALSDDIKYPPTANQPNSALLNTLGAMCVVYGRMIPALRLSVTGGAAPFISQYVAAPDGPSLFGSATTWAASTVYALGAYVVPQTSTGYYYQATAVSGSHTSGTSPGIFAGITTIGQTVVDNSGANQITWTCVGVSTFSVYRVSAGKVQVTWPANTLPAAVTQPTAFLNGVLTTGHSYSIASSSITNGVEVDTMQDTAYADLSFSVEVW